MLEVPVKPLDRSHLLKKDTAFPFVLPYANGIVRIRRERRVCDPFSTIRSLSRNGR